MEPLWIGIGAAFMAAGVAVHLIGLKKRSAGDGSPPDGDGADSRHAADPAATTATPGPRTRAPPPGTSLADRTGGADVATGPQRAGS